MNRGQKITLVKEAATEPQNRIIKNSTFFCSVDVPPPKVIPLHAGPCRFPDKLLPCHLIHYENFHRS
ncbi:hypothetical protein SAMN03159284_04447 [Mucilaginibacter sp. NFR10]|nr:hypothetical protein SAMN03159284_04447 [Mucilaginibacter sp. NFR10]